MQTATSRIWAEATKLASERPLHAVGAIAAMGYLLGGGLLSPLTRRLVELGVRLQLQRFLQRMQDTGKVGDHGIALDSQDEGSGREKERR